MNARAFMCIRIDLVLAVLCILVTPAIAQNESGLRSINKEAFQNVGAWPNDSNITFQVRYPILRSLPPINSGMPYEVLQSYLFLDSIARFDKDQTAREAVRDVRIMNETLRNVVKHIYRVTDYNPMIYAQYLTETTFKLGTRYVSAVVLINDHATKSIYKAMPTKAERGAAFSLMLADYILRVKVIHIDSTLLKQSSDPSAPYQYRVTAEVIDTLKGQRFLPCNEISRTDNADDRNLLLGATPCLNFLYTRRNYFDPQSLSIDWMYKKRDSAFLTSKGEFEMKVGQEAVVFLSHSPALYDSAADYFDLNLESGASFNAVPIIDGQVRDINKVWSESVYLNYEEWKQRFFIIRDKILTGTY